MTTQGLDGRAAEVVLTQITLNCKVVAVELHIRGVSKTYANGVQALKDVTLAIPAGMYGLLALLEPVMIVFLGVVVGGMVVAMYLPIFDMINAVQ